MEILNFAKHCKSISGCNILDFSIIESFETNQRPIYRFFSEKKFAEDFIKGKVRLSTLDSCRKLENLSARDENEGNIHPFVSFRKIDDPNSKKNKQFISDIKYAGGISIHPSCRNLTFGNGTFSDVRIENAFVICTSNNISDYLIENYGKYCVKINYPHLFSYYLHLRMSISWNSLHFRSEKVRYGNQSVDIASNSISKRLGFEKTNKFVPEDEFRILFYNRKNYIEPYFEFVPEINSICDFINLE